MQLIKIKNRNLMNRVVVPKYLRPLERKETIFKVLLPDQ